MTINLLTGSRSSSLLLLAINPFAAAVAGVMHPRDPSSKNLIWLFTIYYGLCFYIAESSGSDSVRYADSLEMMHDSGFAFSDIIQNLYAGANSYQDIYQPLVTFLVSRVTDNHKALFAAFGILLGYVYSRNIWLLIGLYSGRLPVATIVCLAAFALAMGVGMSLNGVRMWTALHVFLFGFLFFSATQNYKYLIVVFLTPLIHFSFVMPCALLLLYFAIRRFGLAIYIFFLSSFVAANLEIGILRSILSYLPLTFEEHADSGDIDRADSSAVITGDGPIWFLALNEQLVTLFILIVSTLLFLRGVHKSKGFAARVFLFGMTIYGATNLVTYVPSAARFLLIGQMLIIAAVIIVLSDRKLLKKPDRQLVLFLTPLLCLEIVLGIRFMLEYTSVQILVGNFFIAPFIEANEGLYEIIKSFL